MDPHEFQKVLRYLQEDQLPFHLKTEQQKKKFRNFCKAFEEIEGQLFWKNKYGMNRKVLKRDEVDAFLYLYHDDPVSGHLGTQKVYKKMKRNYYWPKMFNEIDRYVQGCPKCQRHKGPNRFITATIEPTGPWERVGMDFIGPLEETKNGNRYIIVAMDYLTRWPEARATPTATAMDACKFLYEEIICRHGIVDTVHTDQGRHFVNEMMEALANKFHYKHHRVTAYRPQANGLVEGFNKTLKNMLKRLSEGLGDWDEYIAPALFAYRTSHIENVGVAPDILTYGRSMRLPKEAIKRESMWDRVKHMVTQVPIYRQEALQKIIQLQRNKEVIREGKFFVGDRVLLNQPRVTKGLAPRWIGPYDIIKKMDNRTYLLLRESGTSKPIHEDRLKIYKERELLVPRVVIEQ